MKERLRVASKETPKSIFCMIESDELKDRVKIRKFFLKRNDISERRRPWSFAYSVSLLSHNYLDMFLFFTKYYGVVSCWVL